MQPLMTFGPRTNKRLQDCYVDKLLCRLAISIQAHLEMTGLAMGLLPEWSCPAQSRPESVTTQPVERPDVPPVADLVTFLETHYGEPPLIHSYI